MGILDIIRRRVVSPALNYLGRSLPRRIPEVLSRKPTPLIKDLTLQQVKPQRLGAGGITPGQPLVPVPPSLLPKPAPAIKAPTKSGILTPLPKELKPTNQQAALLGLSLGTLPEQVQSPIKTFRDILRERPDFSPLGMLKTGFLQKRLQWEASNILAESIQESIKAGARKTPLKGKKIGIPGTDIKVDIPSAMGFGGLAAVPGPGAKGKPALGLLKPLQKALGKKAIPAVAEGPFAELTGILKLGRTKIAEQAKLYTKGREEQVARGVKAGEGLTGKARAVAKREALGGEFEKIPGPEVLLRPETPNKMFNAIEESTLDFYAKRNADEALLDILGGKWPAKSRLEALRTVAGDDFIKAAQGSQDWLGKIGEGILQTVNIPRSLMATGEFSGALRQGLPLIPRFKQYFPAFTKMFKAFGSEKAFKQIHRDLAAKPNYEPLRKGGLQLTEMDAALGAREESLMSQWAEKIPVAGKFIRAFGRSHNAFLNMLRVEVADDMVTTAAKSGRAPLNDPALMSSITSYVNNMTGRGALPGGLEKSAVLLNTAIFSPRLQSARIAVLNPWTYARMDPFVRKEAAKNMLGLGVMATSALGLAKLAGADVGADPRSADFGKIKIGDTRVDLGAGYQQYLRLAAQLATGQVVSSTTGEVMTLGEGYKPLSKKDIALRAAEYKASPVLSFVMEWMGGKSMFGGDFDLKTAAAQRVIPMAWQDFTEAVKEHGLPGAVSAVPLGLGVSMQTYGTQYPEQLQQQPDVAAEMERLKLNIWPASKKIGDVELTGEQYDQYQKVSGGIMSEIMTEMVKDPDYQALGDEDKIKLINSIKTGARKKAKEAIGSTYTPEQLRTIFQSLAP